MWGSVLSGPGLAGQAVAVMMALMGVVTKYLVQSRNLSTPALQNTFGYGLTCLLFLPGFVVYRRDKGPITWRRLVAMLIIAAIDSQAAFQSNLAYKYGVHISSAGILSSFTIPVVMMLSFLFLDVRYGLTHLIAVFVSVVGLAMVCFADASIQSRSVPDTASLNSTKVLTTNLVYGDMLLLSSAATYGLSNVFSEGYVKTHHIYEFLVCVSFFGTLMSFLQAAHLGELANHSRTFMSTKTEASFAAYTALFAAVMYTCTKYMEKFDALGFNLSVLTTGLWGTIFGFVLFREEVPILKLIGYVGVVVGIYIYHQTAVSRRPLVEEAPLVNV